MKQANDISILITDKNFQKLLSEWSCYTEEEKAEVYREYQITANDIEILLKLWLGLDFLTFEHPQIMIEKELEKTVWKLVERKNSSSKKNTVRRLFEQFARIAAILFIPLLIYTSYIQFFNTKQAITESTSQLVTVNSQAGTITKLVLPDGSKVCLNGGSSITYPRHFEGATRDVSVTGEAYFEVVKNKKLPMVVSADNINLKVFGTSFNVNAFAQEKFIKVTLVEGSISLSSTLEKFKHTEEFYIEPGQTVTFNKDSKKLIVQKDNTFYYVAWKDGLLVFKNSTFAEVLRQLSIKYNVSIEFKDQTLGLIPMDATFRDENINEILRLLSLSTPFKYYYGHQQKLPDGTFPKSKIYIDKK